MSLEGISTSGATPAQNQEEMIKKFMEGIRARNARQTESHLHLYQAYQELRTQGNRPGYQLRVAEEIIRDIDPTAALKSATEKNLNLQAANQKLEIATQMKTRQIESQQSLLTDLQAQLSLKEKECSEMSSKYSNAQKEIQTLMADLERLQKSLLEKTAEVERLNSKAPTLAVPPPPPPPPPQYRRACVPKKPFRTLGLSFTAASPPCRFSGFTASSGPRLLAIGSKKIQVIDRQSGVLSLDYPLSSVALGVSISPDCSLALAGTTEGQLALLSLQSQRLTLELKVQAKIRNCGFTEHGKFFSASTDRAVRIWDLGKGGVVSKQLLTGSQIIDACVSEDGGVIAVAHQNGKVAIYPGSLEAKIAEFDSHSDACVGVAISRCGKFVASLGRDDRVAVADLTATVSETRKFHAPGFSAFQDMSYPVFSPDSRLVSVCGAADGAVYCFDVSSGKLAGTTNAGDAVCLFWGCTSNEGKDGFELLTGHRNGSLKWWEGTETVKPSL